MRRSGKPPRYSVPSLRRPQPAVPGFIETSLVRPRAAMNGEDAIKQMAEDMRNAAYREGGISADDLETLGFTPDQIRTHGREARRVAQTLSGLT